MKIIDEEWDFQLGECGYFDYDENIYVDLYGNPITGILKDFKFFKEGDSRNNVKVINGKRMKE
jgi:hypothetical protein